MERFVYQTRAETEPLEKTEVLNIGHQREELDIELEGKILNQRDSFVYLGGAVCGDGKTEREVRRRVQAGANTWKAVEEVMADVKKTEGQGHEHLCHTSMPVRNGNLGSDRTTTTQAASVRKQLGPKNSKSNESRQAKNGGVKREETGVQWSLTERLVRSRLQWAGHVERMADERLPKRAAELREQGRRRRGSPRLRWEDCVKRDAKKTREEGDWKKKTGDRGGWRRIADEAVKTSQAAPHP